MKTQIASYDKVVEVTTLMTADLLNLDRRSGILILQMKDLHNKKALNQTIFENTFLRKMLELKEDEHAL